MGQDSRSVFQYLKDSGYAFLIQRFHVKGQVIDSRGIAAWGYGGQTMQRGDHTGTRAGLLGFFHFTFWTMPGWAAGITARRWDRRAPRQSAGQQYRGYGGGLRVSSIKGVERRNNGLRVTGTLSAGGGYGGQYGGQ